MCCVKCFDLFEHCIWLSVYTLFLSSQFFCLIICLLVCPKLQPPSERGGDFICTVYLEEKASGERHVKVGWNSPNNTFIYLTTQFFHLAHIKFHSNKQAGVYRKQIFPLFPQIPGSMTALELTLEILDQRNIPIKDKDYWSCWEICCKEEMGKTDKKDEGRQDKCQTAFVFLCWCRFRIYRVFCKLS